MTSEHTFKSRSNKVTMWQTNVVCCTDVETSYFHYFSYLLAPPTSEQVVFILCSIYMHSVEYVLHRGLIIMVGQLTLTDPFDVV